MIQGDLFLGQILRLGPRSLLALPPVVTVSACPPFFHYRVDTSDTLDFIDSMFALADEWLDSPD